MRGARAESCYEEQTHRGGFDELLPELIELGAQAANLSFGLIGGHQAVEGIPVRLLHSQLAGSGHVPLLHHQYETAPRLHTARPF